VFALVGFVVLAIAGSPRARRFSIAALAAALIHLFVGNQNAAYEPYSPYDPARQFSSPTGYAFSWLWERFKVATPMQTYTPVYAMPPGSPSTVVPPGYVVPSVYVAPPAYVGPQTTYAPSRAADDPSLPPPTDPFPAPTLAPNERNPNERYPGESRPSEGRPENAQSPSGELTAQPASPAWTPLPADEIPADAIPAGYVPASSPQPLPSASIVGSVYPPTAIVMPMEYKPDFGSFLQVGTLNVTLLIGIIAGSATLMLDDFRRRRLRGRTTGSRSQVSGV
jgi:hypothetical protein